MPKATYAPARRASAPHCCIGMACGGGLHLARGQITKAQLRTQGEDTPLHCAADEGHAECVRLLLEHGVDKEAKNDVRALPRAMHR